MRTAAFLLVACALGCEAPAPGVTDISQEQLLSNPPNSALLLDVRTADEFASGHVPGAVNIPHDQLASRLDELNTGKENPVVVYCERGGRAGKAASVLLEAGYQDVRHLAGDMSEWRAKGRGTESP